MDKPETGMLVRDKRPHHSISGDPQAGLRGHSHEHDPLSLHHGGHVHVPGEQQLPGTPHAGVETGSQQHSQTLQVGRDIL